MTVLVYGDSVWALTIVTTGGMARKELYPAYFLFSRWWLFLYEVAGVQQSFCVRE